jgi:hypothetical protein
MKQRLLAAFFGFILLTSSHAQTNYVEVSVTDTVLVQGNQFVFQVMVLPEAAFMTTDTAPVRDPNYYRRREAEMRDRQKQMLDTLEGGFRSAGFTPLPLGIADMMASRGYGNHYLLFRIPSTEALIRLQAFLNQQKGVMSTLQSVWSTEEAAHQDRLCELPTP